MLAEPHWDQFEHEKGMGVVGLGDTLSGAFDQAGRGLTALVTDLGHVMPRESLEIILPARDREALLVDWLNAVIEAMNTRRMVFSEFDVVIEADRLVARLWGEPLDARRHQPKCRPLRAIPAALEVHPEANSTWVARCVVEVEAGGAWAH